MEDQLGTLGLALNAVVLFNTLYVDAAVKQLAADGYPATDDLVARLSPIQFDHINLSLISKSEIQADMESHRSISGFMACKCIDESR